MSYALNLKRSPVDTRDWAFKPSRAVTVLPPVDLRSDRIPILDQGSLGSCTANAGVVLAEYVRNKKDTYYFNLSRAYLYYHSRKLQGWEGQDSGAFIRDMVKVLATKGCCTESRFPYDRTTFLNEPSVEAEENAPDHLITEYRAVYSLSDMVASLLEGYPVVFGIDIHEHFLSSAMAENGILPRIDTSTTFYGSHAMLSEGATYINNELYVIARNSWGKQWGDKGYCYIHNSWFNGWNVFDMWTAR
jgi:C1A family cysteine protease